jgi:hypothetical protein
LTLRFKGNRAAVTDDGISVQIGSIFVVSIEPAAADRAVVTIEGAPTVEGSAACETDHMTECKRLPGTLRKHVDGRAEADVVRGVFAELALEGLVPSPAPSTITSGRFSTRLRCAWGRSILPKIRGAAYLTQASQRSGA